MAAGTSKPLGTPQQHATSPVVVVEVKLLLVAGGGGGARSFTQFGTSHSMTNVAVHTSDQEKLTCGGGGGGGGGGGASSSGGGWSNSTERGRITKLTA